LASYAFDDNPVNLWQPHLAELPKDLKEAFHDPSVLIYGWNVSFEKAITAWILGIDLPIQRFRDVMSMARYLSLPGSLAECGKVLGLSQDEKKMAEGKKLLRMFSLPSKLGGEETLFGISETVYKNWNSHPREWQMFCDYNRQDVIAERAIFNRMKNFQMPDFEQKVWELDQKINERGVAVDTDLVDGGSFIAKEVKDQYSKRLFEITKLENPNSVTQLLGWLTAQGYSFHSLGKPFIARALAGECQLTPEGKEVLEIRSQSSKTASTKLLKIKDQLSSDGRLRFQYSYYGASRTGRWSSGAGE